MSDAHATRPDKGPAQAQHPKPQWARDAGRDEYGQWADLEVEGVLQRMRWIEPGRFIMGSPDDEPGRDDGEGPQHEATIEGGYWLGDTPCTQLLWETVMGSNPSGFKSAWRPVESVAVSHVETFLKKLGELSPGAAWRLPFEAEWEYACRAGTAQATYAGAIEILGANNAPILGDIAWYGGNSGVGFELSNGYESAKWPDKQYDHRRAGTQRVAMKEPNAWGLYDMLGNVWEWCADEQRNYAASSQPLLAPGMPTHKLVNRVVRGGSWDDGARFVRAACRLASIPECTDVGVGFRLARG